MGKRKSYGVNELETLTLAEGGFHSPSVLLLIKADPSECVVCVCVLHKTASYIINSCR